MEMLTSGAQVLTGTWLPLHPCSITSKAGLWVEPCFLELAFRPGADPRTLPFLARSFAKPPKQVQTVCECILIMKGYKELNWKTAKGMMSDSNFLRSLMEMDFDAITQSQVKNIRGECRQISEWPGSFSVWHLSLWDRRGELGGDLSSADPPIVVTWCHCGPVDGEEE